MVPEIRTRHAGEGSRFLGHPAIHVRRCRDSWAGVCVFAFFFVLILGGTFCAVFMSFAILQGC